MNYREVLLSILKLEEMKNWTNVSVSGGIDRFIENNKEKLFVINNSSSFISQRTTEFKSESENGAAISK